MRLSKHLDLMSSCHHEVGHALAAIRYGLTVQHCRVWKPWFGSSHGYCRITGPTTEGPQWAIDAYAVYLAAGEAAQGIYLAGEGVRNAERLAAHGAGADRAEWDIYREFSTLTDTQAWDAAVDVVTTDWPYLTAMADELARRGRLSGRDLARIP